MGTLRSRVRLDLQLDDLLDFVFRSPSVQLRAAMPWHFLIGDACCGQVQAECGPGRRGRLGRGHNRVERHVRNQ